MFWIPSHNDAPPKVRSFHAGQLRLSTRGARTSDTNLAGTSKVLSTEANDWGKNVLTNSSEKQMRLLPWRREAELITPPVISARSRPVKEFTLPVFPPILKIMLV